MIRFTFTWLVAAVLGLMALVAASDVAAYPYRLYAMYGVNPLEAEAAYDVIELEAFDDHAGAPQQPATFVPTAPINATFAGLFIAPRGNEVAKIELDDLRSSATRFHHGLKTPEGSDLVDAFKLLQ